MQGHTDTQPWLRMGKVGAPLPAGAVCHFVTAFNRATRHIERHVHLQTSSIPNAGNGAWWRGLQTLRAGTVLGRYGGIVYRNRPCKYCYYDLSYTDDTAGTAGLELTVCGGSPEWSGWTRYINSVAGTLMEPNAAFTDDAYVVAERDIFPGDEIVMSYGEEYDADLAEMHGTDD